MTTYMRYDSFEQCWYIGNSTFNNKFIKATNLQIDSFFNGSDKVRVLSNGVIAKEVKDN